MPKYDTAKKLARAIEDYFASISRTVTVTELVPTGEYTQKGMPVMAPQKVTNDNGDEIRRVEFCSPPSITDLCLHLGITRETWRTYCDPDIHPEFSDTTTRTRARIEAYLERELLTREKSVQGIIFNLQNNYGWKEKKEVELGSGAVRAVASVGMTTEEKMALLREMAGEIHLPEEKN